MSTETGALLVVDDNQLNRDGLSQLLQSHGYAVTGSQDGNHALDLLGRHRFDLVLLDVMMAGLNGLEVLKRLRGRHPVTELPVIMTTALGQSEDIVEALRLGANDYVTKPIDFPVLLARIQTQLSLKRAVERIRRLEQNLLARNEELQAANAHMKRNLDSAARIQEAFLPPRLPRLLGLPFAWLFRPCEQLAGDMLNIFPLDDDHLGLYVLDVSGHGVAAALLSVTLSHFLSPRRDPSSLLIQTGEGTQGERILPPAEVAALLNSRFPWDPATEQFFTLIYGVLNVRTGELRYVAAGHPGPVYVPWDDPPRLLERPGLPIGVGQVGYKEQTLLLRPRDRLFLYSDGLTEAMGPGGDLFSKEHLLDTVDRCRDVPLKDAVSALWDELERWRGDGPRRDDVSILALEFAESAPRKTRDRPRLQPLATEEP